MADAQPGWYPTGDGMHEAYWSGSEWIAGSKRPVPPRVQVVAPPVPARTDGGPILSSPVHTAPSGIDSFTWRAWVAALSPLTLFVWVIVLAFIPAIHTTAATLIAIALTWITCVAAVAFAEHGLGGSWVAVKFSLSPRLLLVPLFAPTIYLASVGPIRRRSPRWPVAAAVLAVTIGLLVLASALSSGGNDGTSAGAQPSSGVYSAAPSSPQAPLNCAMIASQVIPLINTEAAHAGASLRIVSIRDTNILVDHRQSPPQPPPGGQGTLLKCSGAAVASDGTPGNLVMSALVDSYGGIQFTFEPVR